MKKISKIAFFVALASCMVLPATAFADASDIIASNRQVGLQYVSLDVDYMETGGAYGTRSGPLDSENGTITGLGMMVSWMTSHPDRRERDYYEFEYESVSGNTQYVGALVKNGVAGAYGSYVSSSTASITNFSFRLGEGYQLGSQFMLTPHFEFGSHQWDRGVGLGNGPSALGYNETYTHRWMGIGALGQYSPVRGLVFSANVLVGYTYNASISIPSMGYSGDLGSSQLTRAGLAVDYAILKNLHVNARYDYTSFSYSASTMSATGVFEPDSTTKYKTLKIGVGYAF